MCVKARCNEQYFHIALWNPFVHYIRAICVYVCVSWHQYTGTEYCIVFLRWTELYIGECHRQLITRQYWQKDIKAACQVWLLWDFFCVENQLQPHQIYYKQYIKNNKIIHGNIEHLIHFKCAWRSSKPISLAWKVPHETYHILQENLSIYRILATDFSHRPTLNLDRPALVCIWLPLETFVNLFHIYTFINLIKIMNIVQIIPNYWKKKWFISGTFSSESFVKRLSSKILKQCLWVNILIVIRVICPCTLKRVSLAHIFAKYVDQTWIQQLAILYFGSKSTYAVG